MKEKFLFTFISVCVIISAYTQPKSFESRGIGGGGALFSPSVNPKNNDEIYISCDMSELFHSTSKGKNWQMLHFKNIQGGHNSKVQFTNNDNIRYCIDYSSIDGIDYAKPVKSTDGGKTWVNLSGNPFPYETAYNLSADYNNPDRLILGFYGEIYFSNDAGNTFKKIYTCKSNNEGNHIAGSFFDGSKIYIGLNDGLLTSADNGANFTLLSTTGMPSTEKMISFSAAKDGSGLRFVCLTLNNVWAGIQHGFEYSNGSTASMQGIYTMDNANGTWTLKTNGINKNTDYPVFTGMAENDISTIYIAGSSSTGSPIVMKTTNGGNNWSHVFKSMNNENIYTGWSGHNGDRGWSYGECPFGFCVASNNSNMVLFTDFGFVHGTFDGGTNWSQMYIDNSYQNSQNIATPKSKSYKGIGLENTTNWNILWIDSTKLLSSFSDINGVVSNDKGLTWKMIPNLTQNTVYHIVKNNSGTIYAATSSVHDMYQSTRLTDATIDGGKGAVYYSNDKGNSFSLLHDFAHPVIWLALDPTNSNRMYASVIHSTLGGIYVSNDINKGSLSTWSKLSNPPRTQGHPFVIYVLKNGDILASYSGRRAGNPMQFTNSSGVFYSPNNGNTWSDVSDNKMKYWTKDITIDPFDSTESTWFAAVFSGWGSNIPAESGGLYRTKNKGFNWEKISDSVSSYRVNSCTVNPLNNNEMYYTTETAGLWFSNNAKDIKPNFTLVESYPFRHPVRVNFNPYNNSEICISGFGSGMMFGKTNSGASIRKISKIKTLHIYPNPAKSYIQIDLNNNFSYEIFSITGEKIKIGNTSKAYEKIIIDDLTCGLYFINIKTKNNDFTGKFIFN
ncbi:MAG: T9SS type A sorting domain-containing protein [Bacteroidia bacterium]|nr:T9SS type A sorting domain-containing protein [Bacteroidia bacterium]